MLAVELRRSLVGIRVGILLRGLDVTLARLTMLLVGACRALARLRLLAPGLGGLHVGLGARLVGLRSSDLRVPANLACLVPACLVTALAALAARKPQHRQQYQRYNDDRNDHSGIHTLLLPLVPVALPN